jgi:hypothetical protein
MGFPSVVARLFCSAASEIGEVRSDGEAGFTEIPVDLIDGGQFLTAEEMFSERRTDDPMEMVVRSEVAMYFDRLQDGASLLDQVAPRISDLDVAARFSLAKGRLALWLKDYEQAATQLQTAYHFYLFLGEPFGLSQAQLGLARLAWRGDFKRAAARARRKRASRGA